MNKDKFRVTITGKKYVETINIVGVDLLTDAVQRAVARAPLWTVYDGGLDIKIECIDHIQHAPSADESGFLS